MASISSLGVGSGVLNSDLIDQLVAAERKPADDRLNFKKQSTEALISAYGKLRSAVTELRLPMRQLSAPDNLKAFSATSSNSDVGVSIDSTKASRGSYSIQVDSLAQAQSLASATFADKDSTAVGTGSLTLTVGDKTTTINVDSSNNTLQGLANAINDAGAGATAGVIDTGSGFRLVLSSENSGTDNAIGISVSDTDGNSADTTGLSRFSFNGTNNNLTETVAAKDAIVQVNGITITRSTNTIDNVIDGLSFTAKAKGAVSTVKVEQDTGAVADRVQSFVDKFNALQQTIDGLAGYNASTGRGGILNGDSTIRNIQGELRSIITRVVPGMENSSVRSLADVGITTDFQSGGLQFDRDKFESQLRTNPDDVTALFAEQGRSTDSQVEFVRSGLSTEPGSYAVNVTRMATQGLLTGSSALLDGVTIDTSNDQLSLEVDGQTPANITLTQGTYATASDLVAEIQSQLNDSSSLSAAGRSVQVGLDGNGKLTFTSGKFGSDSSVAITSIESGAATSLGLSTTSAAAGQDVGGTINGQTAVGDGQVLYLGSGAGPASGLQVRITGGTTGSRGEINFIEGVGERTVNLVTRFLSADGALESRTDSLNRDLEDVAKERARLDARIESYQERLKAQFSSADSLIAQLNNTRDYVTQQLAALAPQNKNSS